MTIFRGSKQSTLPDGSIVATQASILDAIDSAQQAQAAAVNDAIAAKNAAEAAETGAQTSETNAETAETNAETAETNAETAESGAVDAQGYAQEWANKAEDSLVSTDAGGDGVDDFSALHHANKASDSASAASTSESNALTSEQNAQQAATDAETALDTFTDQYLGAKASDPTTDNDGDPLQDGALYFNTSDNSLKVYSDSLSSWIVVDVRSDSNIRNLFSAGGNLTYNSTTGEFSVTTYKSSDFDTDFSGKDTDDLSEGTTNLYYTDTRARNALSASGDLSYSSSTGTFSVTTYKSSDFDSDFSGKNTDDLSEGVTNLYFIEAPEDGGQYVRQNASWIEVDLSSATVDLGTTVSSNSIVVTNTGGTDATIPAADANNAGLVSTSSQTFDGIKTFQNELRCESDIVAFYSSDSRLKENITDIQGALASLDKIRGVEYDWTEEYLASKGGEDNAFTRKHDVGVIAQELQEVLPEAVLERSDGFMGVRYEKIVPLLLQAVKELKSELDQLKQEK
jgi:hypothetical protein